MENKAGNKESKLIRFLKSPLRVLIKARDFYMNSMTQCAGRVEYGGGGGVMGGGPTAQISTLPKSFSVSSSRSGHDDDLTELMRVASTRSLNGKVQEELLRRQQSPAVEVEVVPRSQSAGIGIGRIDEEKSCEFEGDDLKVNVNNLYPRSKSHAVNSNRVKAL